MEVFVVNLLLVFELEFEPLGVLRTTNVDLVPMPVWMWMFCPRDSVLRYTWELSDLCYAEFNEIFDDPIEEELLTDWAVVPFKRWLFAVDFAFSF